MLKELRANHRAIIQMSFNGFRNQEIAEKTGMSPGTISQILRSPMGQAYMNGLQDRAQENTIDVRKKLIDMNKDALATLSRILDPKVKAPYNVQLSAAKDVLDRNGYKPSDKFEIDVFSHKSDEEIENEIRAMEAAVARNQLSQSASVQEAQNSPALDGVPEVKSAAWNDDSNEFSSSQSESVPEDFAAPSGRPETSSDASNNLPADLLEKLADSSFDPFQNIGQS